MKPWKRWLALVLLLLFSALLWLAATDNSWVKPRRAFIQYQLLSRWWSLVGEPQTGPPGTIRGTVRDSESAPVAEAWVLLSRWDGTTFSSRSDADGHYRIDDVPAGRYVPVAGAPGYADVLLGPGGSGVWVRAGKEITVDVVLPPQPPRPVEPGQNLVLGPTETLSCSAPLDSTATRRVVTFDNAGQPNQLTYLYTPAETTPTARYPLLLTIYPGPANTWECASIPLAEAGYAVLAIGPPYSLDLAAQIDEIERLLAFADADRFPQTDATRAAVLGGSYSGLHTMLLLQRNRHPNIRTAVLLGAPTDLFAMRRHLEEGTFIPPFGLDIVLVTLGLPDRQPMLYWEGSGAYHIRADMPPLLVIHSYSDNVVPYDQSELLISQLAEAGVPYQVKFFEKADHYLLHEGGETDAIYDLTLTFLAEILKQK